MYGFKPLPGLSTKEGLEVAKQEVELFIKQIKNALVVLKPKRHKAAIICLGESLRIVEQGLAEIQKQMGGG